MNTAAFDVKASASSNDTYACNVNANKDEIRGNDVLEETTRNCIPVHDDSQDKFSANNIIQVVVSVIVVPSEDLVPVIDRPQDEAFQNESSASISNANVSNTSSNNDDSRNDPNYTPGTSATCSVNLTQNADVTLNESIPFSPSGPPVDKRSLIVPSSKVAGNSCTKKDFCMFCKKLVTKAA